MRERVRKYLRESVDKNLLQRVVEADWVDYEDVTDGMSTTDKKYFEDTLYDEIYVGMFEWFLESESGKSLLKNGITELGVPSVYQADEVTVDALSTIFTEAEYVTFNCPLNDVKWITISASPSLEIELSSYDVTDFTGMMWDNYSSEYCVYVICNKSLYNEVKARLSKQGQNVLQMIHDYYIG